MAAVDSDCSSSNCKNRHHEEEGVEGVRIGFLTRIRVVRGNMATTFL